MSASSSSSYSADEEYFNSRKAELEKREKETGIVTYPHKFKITQTVREFITTYHDVEADASLPDSKEALAGRIANWREQSKKLVFCDIVNDGYTVQVVIRENDYVNDSSYSTFVDIINILRRGDFIGVCGIPYRTKRGELSLLASRVDLLSPCLHMLPTKLTDQETRYRKRHLDFIVNSENRNILVQRAAIISFIRKFFNERGFLEVETPCINMIAGGAAARPFFTKVNATGEDAVMRISPELYLKQLVVGGFHKVYEIGRQFRNEGLDLTHNPEFTSIESYEAFCDYFDIMEMTETLLSRMVFELKGSYKFMAIPFHGEKSSTPVEVDFTPPFRRIPMIKTLEEVLEVTFPRPLDSDECNAFLRDLCEKRGIEVTPPMTTTRLLDTLTGEFLEPMCVNPTFIIDHPQVMSPLAKYHRNDRELTERFEMFCMGKEFVNAYTELNDPHVQRDCFSSQLKDREAGDDEAQKVDWTFVNALDHGLPPTGGWGMGIDRLVMLLTGQSNIKEVLSFPMMKS